MDGHPGLARSTDSAAQWAKGRVTAPPRPSFLNQANRAQCRASRVERCLFSGAYKTGLENVSTAVDRTGSPGHATERANQDGSPAASREGSTAIRSVTGGVRPNQWYRSCFSQWLHSGPSDNCLATYSGRFIFLRNALYRGSPFSEFNKGWLLMFNRLGSLCVNARSSERKAASHSPRDAWIAAIQYASPG